MTSETLPATLAKTTMFHGFLHYLAEIYRNRHFCVHLAFADLRARFRRSYFGIIWAMLQPLLLTVVMSTVLVFIFQQPFREFSVYVFSGLIAWEFFTGMIVIGSACFISAEGYIKQVRLPNAIYPIKAVIYCMIVFLCAFLGYFLYTLFIAPATITFYWVWVIPFMLMMIVLGMPLAIICAIVNLKYRDFQQFIGIALQMLWYVSPVFILRSVFDNPGLKTWTLINPVTAIMDIFRDPLVNSTLPSLYDYGILGAYSLFFWVVALWMLRREERRIVFYY
jgi:lipopolysaccharide transport system permease protein